MKLKDSEKPLIQPRVWKTTEIIPKFLSHGCMLGGTKIWIVKRRWKQFKIHWEFKWKGGRRSTHNLCCYEFHFTTIHECCLNSTSQHRINIASNLHFWPYYMYAKSKKSIPITLSSWYRLRFGQEQKWGHYQDSTGYIYVNSRIAM